MDLATAARSYVACSVCNPPVPRREPVPATAIIADPLAPYTLEQKTTAVMVHIAWSIGADVNAFSLTERATARTVYSAWKAAQTESATPLQTFEDAYEVSANN